jgi:POT family proton-dependent oligopeptide transporter
MAYEIFGAFTALAYAFLSLGGYIGDKILGSKRTIFLGALVLALGYLILGLNAKDYMFAGFAVIIAGNALFKSNPSSLISKLYSPNDHRVDGAFTMYYMSINIGSFIASFSNPFIAHKWGYNVAFLFSFGGLLFAMVGYIIFYRLIDKIGSEPDFRKPRIADVFKVVFLITILAGLCFFVIKHLLVAKILLYIAILFVFVFFLKLIYSSVTKEERNGLFVCFILICEAVVFYIIYQQRATSMNMFVVRNTHHTIFGIPLDPLAFQSFNSFWILTTSPFLAYFFTKFAKRGIDLSLPGKFTVGMFLCSAGLLVLKIAGSYFADSNGLVAGEWVFLSIGFLSVGEIFIGGIGLAMIARLVPRRVMGVMMGIWFMSTAIAMVLGGYIAAYSNIPKDVVEPLKTLPIYTNLFYKLGIAALLFSFLMLFSTSKLRSWIK